MNIARSVKGLTSSLLLLSGTAFADNHDFSVVVLPDSQFIVGEAPHVFLAQMDWIVRNKDTENIIYVTQLGDLKDDQLCDDKAVANPETGVMSTEWGIVNFGYQKLDRAGIPYGLIPGNHDYEQFNGGCLLGNPGSPVDRDLTTYDSLFGPAAVRGLSRFDNKPWFGDFTQNEQGSFQPNTNDDNFTLFGQCGVDFIGINLGYRSTLYSDNSHPDCDTSDPLRAGSGCRLLNSSNAPLTNTEIHRVNELLAQYPNRLAVITSHYALNSNSELFLNAGNQIDFNVKPVVDRNQFGDYMGQVYEMLGHHPNLFMIFGAHWFGEAWRTETRGSSLQQPVQIMMSNYQAIDYPTEGVDYPTGGNPDFDDLPFPSDLFGDSGFMRIMRFHADTKEVTITTFSPGQVRDPNNLGAFLTDRQDDLISDFNPQQGLPQYANAGNSMNHGTASSGFTVSWANYVTQSVNCNTTKSRALELVNGRYDVSSFDSATLNVSSTASSADFNDSYGYYVTDADGNPSFGRLVYRNIKTASAGAVNADLSAAPGAASLGFFIIPDGDRRNNVGNGTALTFTQSGSTWVPRANGVALSGQGAAAFFSEARLNTGNVNYFNGSQTQQRWEDLVGGGDQDFNDVIVNLTNVTGNSN